jgi:CubicO group peptidase (beta-lactamase class C family)
MAIQSNMEFGIASNTKLFVSTVMLKLAENNQLDLDASIGNWLPTYPNINPLITIRQLLNHTSGISDPLFISPYMDTINNNANRNFSPEEVISWIGTPQFIAGSSWGYSNVNYILAGMIAENVTGFHISQLIRDSILTPLNLDSTFYDVQEPSVGIVAHRWWNLIDYQDTSTVGLNSAGGCAGAMYSTSDEMAQWYNALFSGQILNQSSLAQLTTFVPTQSPTYDYGLGLSRETTQNRTYWTHGGRTWGYRSKMIYDSCMNATVCGLTNSDPSGMDGVTFLLYRVLLNHLPACSAFISGPSEICQGQNSITYSISPISGASSYEWELPNGINGSSSSTTITVSIAANASAGTISVRGVNSYGKGGSSTLFIQVNSIPNTPIITQIGNTLHSNASSGNQWYNENGILIGEINQDLELSASGNYYVIVSEMGCNSAPSNAIQTLITNNSNSIVQSNFKLFPNPVLEELTIETNGQLSNFEMFDLTGKLLFSGIIKDKVQLNTSMINSGFYIIRIENQIENETFKLTKF